MSFLHAVLGVLAELSPWLLLGAAVAGALHTLLPPGFVARWLRGRGGILRAVLLGVPLPLCSCSVIPTGLGLRKDGASRGATIGFLTATPQTGVDSVLVSGAMLGWPFALFKVLAAFVLGMTGGALADRIGGEADAAPQATESCSVPGSARPGWREGFSHSLEMLRTIWGWLTVGILLSAALSTWVPAGAWTQISAGGFLSLVLTLAISIPLYVCATASVPIAASLVAAGFPPGAALVFLMAGPATNAATLGAVRGAFGTRTTLVYLLNIVVGSLLLGASFDFLLGGTLSAQATDAHAHSGPVSLVASALLALLLAWFAFSDARTWLLRRSHTPSEDSTVELDVDGLKCGGCVRRLTGKLEELDGVSHVLVVREPRGHATISGSLDLEQAKQAIHAAGFETP